MLVVVLLKADISVELDIALGSWNSTDILLGTIQYLSTWCRRIEKCIILMKALGKKDDNDEKGFAN